MVDTVDSMLQLKANLAKNDSSLKTALGAALPFTPVVVKSGAAITPIASEEGSLITATSASAVAVTLPNALAVGYSVSFAQIGNGQLTFAAASGAFMRQASSLTKTRAKYSSVTAVVIANVGGAAAEWLLVGDMA